MNKKQTGKSIAKKASGILQSSISSTIQKKLSGSVLSQSSTKKQTSKRIGSSSIKSITKQQI